MLFLCGLFIAFQAAVGFLFGQLFAGHLSLAASLAGGSGLACAVGSLRMAVQTGGPTTWIAWAAGLTLAGVGMDIAGYYRDLNIPGNYYPWFLVAPFSACTVLVGYTAHRRAKAPAGA